MPVVDYAARRAAKLAAHQMSLPPGERIINRDDWDQVIEKKVSFITRRRRADARAAFVETAIDPNVGICDTREEAQAFFQRGGRRFTCKILRMFLEASAISRTGRIEDVLSVRTLRHLMVDLFQAAEVAGNEIERDIKNDTLLFIEGSLLPRNLAHTKMKDKPSPIPRDITTFMLNLFDRRFMSTLPTTRDVLLIALFVCLSIDCSTRPSELLVPNWGIEGNAAFKIERPNKIFTWSSIEIFAFKNDGAEHVKLQARITFKDLKDNFGVFAPGLSKTIPLRLLPPEFAAEDSLFWLMVLGLIDGVFADVSNWSEINQLQPGTNGMKVRIKDSMMKVPVFRLANRPQSRNDKVKDNLISSEPMDAIVIRRHLRSLSRFCGIEHAMLPNVLRRGAAYQLALTVSSEERCARMGHSGNDPSYWRHYRNRTSTVDFQGRRHGIKEDDVEMMSSMFLDTGNGQPPPVRVSEEGMAEVYQDPDVLALLTEQSEIADELVLQYGSLREARYLDPDRWKTYSKLRTRHSYMLGQLAQKKFNDEYKAHFKAAQGVATDPTQHPTPDVGPSEVDLLLDDQDTAVADDAPATEQELKEEAEATSALLELSASLDLVDIEETDENSADVPAPVCRETRTNGWFGFSETAMHSLVDEVATHLYEQSPDATWESLADYFVVAFNHLHRADRFFPGQEPLPGTFDCRFCGLPLHSVENGTRNAQTHAWTCEGERLAQRSLDELRANDATAVSVCPILSISRIKRHNGALVSCWAKMTDPEVFAVHMLNKHRTTTHYQCFNHDPVVTTDQVTDFRIHAVKVHHAPTAILKLYTPNGKLSTQELVYFCSFCQVWILRTEQLEHDHISNHMGDAVEIIAARGVVGLWVNMRWAYPGFCPFCIYDTELYCAARLRSFASPESLVCHIEGHLMKLSETTPCPATTSTPEGLPQCPESKSLTQAELAVHLRDSHGFNIDLSKEEYSDRIEMKKADDRQKSKRAKTTGRSPLAEIDVNQ